MPETLNMQDFNHPDVNLCMYLLSRASTPSEAIGAWLVLQNQYPSLAAVINLDTHEENNLPPVLKKYHDTRKSHIVPYIAGSNLYFLGDDIIKRTLAEQDYQFGIDHSLMFDTNIATYIDKLVRKQPLGNVQAEFTSAVSEILRDNLNFDHLFYMVENIKNVHHQIENDDLTKIDFWRSLNKAFRRNLVSLQLFQSIDTQNLNQNFEPRPTFTYIEAVRKAVEFAFDFYISEVGREQMQNFVLLQRVLLLHVIGILRIQLSSARSAKNKMADYFQFVQFTIGAYLDREAIVAHHFFLDEKNVPMLEKIKRGTNKKRLLKRLDNIAWDMASPRFMERLISNFGNRNYFLPILFTFDANLKKLLTIYPIKGVIFNRRTGAFHPLPKINTREYFEEHGCVEFIDQLYSDEFRLQRLAREKPDRASLRRLIAQEYRELRMLL
jgi:hypothetical protein